MIRDDADFHPVDHDIVVRSNRETQGLNLKNVIAFLKENGAEDNMIHQVEQQCSSSKGAGSENNRTAEKKQTASGSADASQPTQDTVYGNPMLYDSFQQDHSTGNPEMASTTT